MLRINHFGRTDAGRVREVNEDAFILKPDLALFAVADGMGGEEKGEVASRIFIEAAAEVFSRPAQRSEEEMAGLVQEAFALANERVLNWARANRIGRMGCTAELIAFCGPDYAVGHVGDSRTYRFREGLLSQLTRDHSFVQAQVDQGLLTPAGARKSPLRNIILRAVGTQKGLDPDILPGKAFPGDIYLLCSDGLTGMLEDPMIEGILARSWDLSRKGNRLVEEANLAGGTDNITVVLCEILGS